MTIHPIGGHPAVLCIVLVCVNSHDWNETRKTDGVDAALQEGGPSASVRALAGGVVPSRRTCRMLRAHLAALDALEGDFRQNLGRLTAPVASGL